MYMTRSQARSMGIDPIGLIYGPLLSRERAYEGLMCICITTSTILRTNKNVTPTAMPTPRRDFQISRSYAP